MMRTVRCESVRSNRAPRAFNGSSCRPQLVAVGLELVHPLEDGKVLEVTTGQLGATTIPGGRQLYGLLATASTTTLAERWGVSCPSLTYLYAHRPSPVPMHPRDVLRLSASKTGTVTLQALLQPIEKLTARERFELFFPAT